MGSHELHDPRADALLLRRRQRTRCARRSPDRTKAVVLVDDLAAPAAEISQHAGDPRTLGHTREPLVRRPNLGLGAAADVGTLGASLEWEDAAMAGRECDATIQIENRPMPRNTRIKALPGNRRMDSTT